MFASKLLKLVPFFFVLIAVQNSMEHDDVEERPPVRIKFLTSDSTDDLGVETSVKGTFKGHGTEAQATLTSSGTNLLLASVGAGVLSYPYAFHSSGIVVGVLLTLFANLVTIHFQTTLGLAAARFGPRMRIATYEELMRVGLGRWAYMLSAGTILITSLGVLIGFFVIIHDILSPVLETIAPEVEWVRSRAFVIIVFAACVALPLSFFPNMHGLYYANIVGIATVLFTAIFVWVRGLEALAANDWTWRYPVNVIYSSASEGLGALTALPIYFFSLSCCLQIVPTYLELRDGEKPAFPRLVTTCTSSVMVFYVITGTLGYAAHGEFVKGDILAGFAGGDYMITTARALMAIHVGLASPIVLFPCRQAIINMFLRIRKHLHTQQTRNLVVKSGGAVGMLVGGGINRVDSDSFGPDLERGGVPTSGRLAALKLKPSFSRAGLTGGPASEGDNKADAHIASLRVPLMDSHVTSPAANVDSVAASPAPVVLSPRQTTKALAAAKASPATSRVTSPAVSTRSAVASGAGSPITPSSSVAPAVGTPPSALSGTSQGTVAILDASPSASTPPSSSSSSSSSSPSTSMSRSQSQTMQQGDQQSPNSNDTSSASTATSIVPPPAVSSTPGSSRRRVTGGSGSSATGGERTQINIRPSPHVTSSASSATTAGASSSSAAVAATLAGSLVASDSALPRAGISNIPSTTIGSDLSADSLGEYDHRTSVRGIGGTVLVEGDEEEEEEGDRHVRGRSIGESGEREEHPLSRAPSDAHNDASVAATAATASSSPDVPFNELHFPMWGTMVVSTVVLVFCCTLAIIAPAVNVVFGLVGSTTVPILSIILPAFLRYSMTQFTDVDVLVEKTITRTTSRDPDEEDKMFESLGPKLVYRKSRDCFFLLVWVAFGCLFACLATGVTIYQTWLE